MRDGVARLNHHETDRAFPQISAVVASAIAGDRSAPDRRQRAVENAHDIADADLIEGPSKGIAAPLAMFGIDEPGAPQFGQYLIEKPFEMLFA